MSLITSEYETSQTNSISFNWPTVLMLFLVLAVPAIPATLILYSVIFTASPGDGPFTFVNELYFSTPSAVIVHGFSGVVFFLTLPLQFSPALRANYRKLHKISGYLVFISGITMGWSGVWMHLVLSPEQLGGRFITLVLMAGVMSFSFIMALKHILQRNVLAHEKWVIRAVAITLGVITSMFVEVFLSMTIGQIESLTVFLNDFNYQYARFVAVCLNLIVVELFFNKKTRYRHPRKG